MEMKRIQDRIGEYLISHVDDFLFDELSDNYLEKAGIADILSGVPVPIRKTALSNLSTLVIAQNMAFIVGCDLNFKYRDNYVAYILRTFTKDFARPLIGDGVEAAAKNDFDHACICFRAALLIDPDNVDALYCYGRACKDSYENGEGEEYIGRYKAESLEAFEKLTLKKPDFDMGFYFLGYGYLNLGLYWLATRMILASIPGGHCGIILASLIKRRGKEIWQKSDFCRYSSCRQAMLRLWMNWRLYMKLREIWKWRINIGKKFRW